MKKLLFTIAVLILIQIKISNAQNHIFNLNQIFSKPDSAIKIFLDTNNPTFLNYDEDKELLYIKTSYFTDNQNFRRYFEPAIVDIYEIQFSGKKNIGKKQIFKGIFGFNKLIRKNWNWVFNRDYDSGNPFLLGDSSSGKSVFNGIFFKVYYYNQLLRNSSFGVKLEYLVDEGLKQVSPKPTSQHRDIKLKVGASYSPFNFIKFSLAGLVEDKKEEISYKEDEGAVYKEVTLLKFRGLDFPIIAKKKTETRILYQNNFAIKGNFILNPINTFLILSDVEKGIEQFVSKEEITNPSNQGYYQNDYLNSLFKTEFYLNEKLKSNFILRYFSSNGWSKHPDYNSLFLENYQNLICYGVNFSFQFTNDLNFNLGGGIGQLKLNVNDYYSNVFFDIKSIINSILIGFKFNFHKSAILQTNFLIEKYYPTKSSILNYQSGVYFQKYLMNDIDYLKTEFYRYNLSVSLLLKLLSGEVLLSTDYLSLVTAKNSSWNNAKNKILNSSIEYRIKVY